MSNADCKGTIFLRADISLADLNQVNYNDANMAHLIYVVPIWLVPTLMAWL